MPVVQHQPAMDSTPSAGTSSSSPTNKNSMTISDLLGLNMPRGPTLGQTSTSTSHFWSSSPVHDSTETSPATDKNQRARPPYFPPFSKILEKSHMLKTKSLSQPYPTSTEYGDLVQPFSPISPLHTSKAFKAVGSGTPPYSDCGSPSLENTLMQMVRSISPTESDGSQTSCDLLELMNNLSITPQGGVCSPPTEQEMANLRALHNLTNNSVQNVNQAVYQPWLYTFPTPPLENKQNPLDNIDVLELVARFHRNQAASFFDATLTWRGVLPPRFISDNPTFSCKVFLGGVPWDVSEESLVSVFKHFGEVQVEWPGKDKAPNQPKGCAYIIFESEKQVKALINCCKRDVSNGNCENWYYRISSRKIKSKEVQVIPWSLSDSNFMESPNQKLDPHCTVFVGALHGMLNAEGLFHIMNDLFGGVIYAGIDTDKFRYPIGSARVCFNNQQSYINAVQAAFIEIKTVKFVKKVQVDPYLEDSPCSGCWVRQGPYFCKELSCFRYFCHSCWSMQHQFDVVMSHKPLTRSAKTHPHPPGKMRFIHQ